MSIAMETPEAPAVEAASPSSERLFRLGVEQYLKMVEVGILGPDDRVELLEGLLVKKMGKNPPHILAGKNVLYTLIAAIPAGWHLSIENPVATETSVPEPDCSVVRGDRRDYGNRLPNPGEVALVVEVADSSLPNDLKAKKRIYAAAAIPFYWVVNIPDHRLEVFSDPTGPSDAADYRHHAAFGADDSIPLVLDGQEVARIAVRDLLP